jgi:hypothetical protein
MKLFNSFCLSLVLVGQVGCTSTQILEKAISKLRLGMSKPEMEEVLDDWKFLKEQTVIAYPGSTEQETRAVAWSTKTNVLVFPENLITEQLPFDGSIKVRSYLIKRDKMFAVPVVLDYLAIFYNKETEKVVGWAHLREMGEVKDWPEEF